MANRIPDSPDVLLRREATAAALTALGFQTKAATLATKATRGGGPPYRCFGRVPLYRWGDALAWAQSRLSAPRASTSEADAQAHRAGVRDEVRNVASRFTRVAVAGENARPIAVEALEDVDRG